MEATIDDMYEEITQKQGKETEQQPEIFLFCCQPHHQQPSRTSERTENPNRVVAHLQRLTEIFGDSQEGVRKDPEKALLRSVPRGIRRSSADISGQVLHRGHQCIVGHNGNDQHKRKSKSVFQQGQKSPFLRVFQNFQNKDGKNPADIQKEKGFVAGNGDHP